MQRDTENLLLILCFHNSVKLTIYFIRFSRNYVFYWIDSSNLSMQNS